MISVAVPVSVTRRAVPLVRLIEPDAPGLPSPSTTTVFVRKSRLSTTVNDTQSCVVPTDDQEPSSDAPMALPWGGGAVSSWFVPGAGWGSKMFIGPRGPLARNLYIS